jgi:hypothetical protein
LALNVATLGSSMVLGVPNAAKIAELRRLYFNLQATWAVVQTNTPALRTAAQAAQLAAKYSSYGYAAGEFVNTAALVSLTTPEDIARAAAQITAIVDSSGVAATIGSFTYPRCSKYEEVLRTQ